MSEKNQLPEWLDPVESSIGQRFKETFLDPSTEQLPEYLEEARPGILDRASQYLQGTGQELIATSPAVAGAVAGLTVGLPGGPIPAVTGMVLGGIGGYYAGQSAEEGYKDFFPEPTDPTLKIYREGGKILGGALTFTAAVPHLPTMTGNRVSQFVTDIRDAAKRNPKTFKISEFLGGLGASGGGMIAESEDPGAPGTRLAGEVIGGIVAPGRFLINQTGTVIDGLSKISSSFSAGAREARAASRLRTIMEEFGEDIPALIRGLEAGMPIDQLSSPGAKRITPTSGQKTDSLGFTALESALGQTNKKFLGEVKEQGRQAAQAYQLLTDRLKNIGTPDALAMAANLQKGHFESMLEGRLADADRISALKISGITKNTPQARRAIGEAVKDQTVIALREARDYESILHKEALSKMSRRPVDMPPGVPLNVVSIPTLAPKNTVKDFMNYTLGLGDAVIEGKMPPVVKGIMAEFGVTPNDIKKYKAGRRSEEFALTGEIPARFLPKAKELDLSELVNYRSNLLKMAREAAGNKEVGNADFYNTLAQSLMKDLNTVQSPEFDEARAFSKALNDVFTRSFASTVTGVKRSGEELLPPETLVKRAFGTDADMTAMRMVELEDAVKFMSTQYDSAVARFGSNSPQAIALKPGADVSRAGAASMADAQQRVLRMGASAAVDTTFDPATGREVTRLNTAKLNRFVEENRPMLDKLGITPDLTDAVKAENAFRMVQSENSALMKRASDQYAFGQVLKVGNERPSIAIASMLNGNTPVRDMKNLVKMAMDSDNPEAAVRGLKHSLYDYAYTKAGGSGGKFSPAVFENAFFQKLAPDQPSVVNIMRANGLLTMTEMKNIKRLTDPMIRIERSMAAGRTLDEIIPGVTPIEDLMQSVIGARLGTSVVPGGPASLIAASAGSKAVKNIFSKMPGLSTVAILERAVQDPAFAALLLKKGRTEKEKIQIARQLHGYMLNAGLNYATYEEPEPATSQSPPNPGQAARELNQFDQSLRQVQKQQRTPTVAPSTRGVPGLSFQPAAPGQPGAASGAPTNANARSQFQALFPNDGISNLAAQQQQQPPAPR